MEHFSATDVRAPRMVAGRYRVEDALGRGGSASVHRAQDIRDGRWVALKLLRQTEPERNERHLAMLRREFHTLSELAHPRIIEVYDYGESDGLPYYTMELLDGSDLTDAGCMPWREACAVLRDVASSLAILHSRGLVHRDVSTRNVRRTADGRAKLLDFGAMQPLGPARNVVGTPPFMAPEAVLMQSLDARVDLFSLGALAYYMLTGRHAFPARRISDLRDTWRSRPIPPVRIVAGLPRSLSDLVMQLLSLDRAGRPAGAGEVITRLTVLADLPSEDALNISRAYLTTPILLGREEALVAIRRSVLCFIRRAGGSVVIGGESGSGRSRMLDTCAMEAKLLGAQVVRVDASDASGGDWAVASALCSKLHELDRRVAEKAGELNRELLGHVVPEFARHIVDGAPRPTRSQLVRALRDFILDVCGAQRVVILADDVDRVDEPSVAVLVAVGNKAMRCPLLVVSTFDSEQLIEGDVPLRMLERISDRIDIACLGQVDTERLIGSLFGDVPHVSTVARRIHATTHGNPRATMAFAEYLAAQGHARYERGSWMLPSKLEPTALPASLSDALSARLRVLGDDARDLAEALALADEDPVHLEAFVHLTAHGDSQRMFRALDELVAARVLVADGDRYAFSQRTFATLLQEGLTPARRAEISGRLADLTEGEPVRLLHHLLNAGRDAEAINLSTRLDLVALLPNLDLLERVLERAEANETPARVVHDLRLAVLSKASLTGAAQAFARAAPAVIEQVRVDSGLAAYEELNDLPHAQRLQRALELTQQRYDACPDHERVLTPLEGIRGLARVSGTFVSMGTTLLDLPLLESLPSLAPFESLSPALACVSDIVEGGLRFVDGRRDQAIELYRRVLERMAHDDRAGFDEAQYHRTYYGLNYVLGLMRSQAGSSAAEEHAKVLEGENSTRANAWFVRSLMHLYQGNIDEARKCRRRADLLQLQHHATGRYIGHSGGFALRGHVVLNDIIGLREIVSMMDRYARMHSGWLPGLAISQSCYRRLTGDAQGALDALESAFELAPPGRHMAYIFLAEAKLAALLALDRVPEAVAHADAVLATLAEHRLPDFGIFRVAAAGAFRRGGRSEDALAMCRQAIDSAHAAGTEGLALGILYEERARLALALRDLGGFEDYVQRCSVEYDKARNPALRGRLAVLLDESRPPNERGSERVAAAYTAMTVSQTDTQQAELRSRLHECVDTADRSRCALTLLLQSSDSQEGCLYGVSEEGEVALLASVPSADEDPAVRDAVRQFVARERELLSRSALSVTQDLDECADETQTGEVLAADVDDSGGFVTDESGRLLEPFAMIVPGQRQRIAAVLLRRVGAAAYIRPSSSLLAELARELVDRSDVSGLALDLA